MIQYRHMKINDGIWSGVITAEMQESAVESWLKRWDSTRTYHGMMNELKIAGAPMGTTCRGADRLLQKLRKAGVIRSAGGGKWVQA